MKIIRVKPGESFMVELINPNDEEIGKIHLTPDESTLMWERGKGCHINFSVCNLAFGIKETINFNLQQIKKQLAK